MPGNLEDSLKLCSGLTRPATDGRGRWSRYIWPKNPQSPPPTPSQSTHPPSAAKNPKSKSDERTDGVYRRQPDLWFWQEDVFWTEEFIGIYNYIILGICYNQYQEWSKGKKEHFQQRTTKTFVISSLASTLTEKPIVVEKKVKWI